MNDEHFLRRAYRVALQARARGDRPFGAVVVEGDEILVEGGSKQGSSGGGPLAHSEMVALNLLLHTGIARERLARATIYSSGEPCAMCAAAIFYSGIGRVVYGLPAEAIAAARNAQPHTAGLGLSCRQVLQAAAAPIEVVGPLLEDEGAIAHEGYWVPGAA
ncbi:MAG: nucleoside deaminase [Rubritepida sp.]|nr:nucleoside deaminase [Rubritepida sp.]